MSEMVFVKPAEGMRVRDPMRNYEPLPSEGKRVPLNGFWQRRINLGDVVVTTKKSQVRRASKPKPPEEKPSTGGSE